MNHPCPIWFALVLATLVLPNTAAAQDDDWRTIEFETTQVTEADVAISPDGEWLIFTILGHLFRLPVEGGDAEQLTFGPYYDTDPVFSPDGKRVAFVSDRDGSDGNVFVLELATGQITQVTHEPWAARPIWSPDGQAIVYLRVVPEGPVAWWPALLRRVAVDGQNPESLSAEPRIFRSVFYLPDGRLGWAVAEPDTQWGATTRIEAMSPDGSISTLRTLLGYVAPVVPTRLGDGLYYRRLLGSFYNPLRQDLVFLELPDGAERPIGPAQGFRLIPIADMSRFGLDAENKSLYLEDAGRLWKILLPSGRREYIPFRARTKMEIQDPVPAPKWTPAAAAPAAPPRHILHPRLSPDGRTLVFHAAGFLWEQPLDRGPAKRLLEGTAFEDWPAFSPDGRQLAFVHSEYGKQEVRVLDLKSQQMRTVASGRSFSGLSWSTDGQRVIFAEGSPPPSRWMIVVASIEGNKKENLLDASGWFPRPHFSTDGHFLYYSAEGKFYRLLLREKAKPELVAELALHLSNGLVSRDRKWLAFGRNAEIWVAQLGTEPVKEEDVRQLSLEGGHNFAFTSDGSAVIYSAGIRVWRHPVAGGEREEIPIRLELPRPVPPPVLLLRVRVLDFKVGGFGLETSLYIEQGRIRWVGSERGRTLPPETVIVDADGRFAIPGLFDMHVHVRPRLGVFHEAFLAYGVTSVRVPGGWGPWLNSLVDRSEATNLPVPRYFWANFFIHRRGSDVSLQIANEADGQTYVRRSKGRGAHFIKIYPSFPWPLQRAVAEEARRLGLPIATHGMSVEQITKSIQLGYAFLEHLGATRFHDDVIQMLALAGTRWDPTLSAAGGTQLLLRDEPERLEDAKFRAFVPEWCVDEGWARGADTVLLRGAWIEMLRRIRAAQRHGLKPLAGTDYGCFYGPSLHWELEYFVQAGFSTLEVLRLATQEAAAAMGADEELGTLEPGKLADIVLLDKNPLDDIRNTQSIWRVLKGGWVFDPEKLRPPESDSTTK
jgi:imidazolonepropionase-like amidohydrolase